MTLLALLCFLVYNCDKDDNNEEPSSMTATIDGNSFTATHFVFTVISDTITSVIGWAGNEYLGFNLMNAASTGNYDVGITAPHTGTYSGDGQTSHYVSRQGHVQVTENSSTRIKGAFEFIAVNITSHDTILVDNGLFDVSKSE